MQPRGPRKKRSPATRARTPWVPIIIVGVGAIAVVVAVVLGSALLRGNSEVVIPAGIAERTEPQQGPVLGEDEAPGAGAAMGTTMTCSSPTSIRTLRGPTSRAG